MRTYLWRHNICVHTYICVHTIYVYIHRQEQTHTHGEGWANSRWHASTCSRSEGEFGQGDSSHPRPACDVTHSQVGHDSFIRGTWLIHTIRGTWLIYMRDMTHGRLLRAILEKTIRRDKGLYVTWLDNMWDMIHLYVGHDFLVIAFWGEFWRRGDTSHPRPVCVWRVLVNTWETTDVYVRHDSIVCDTWFMIAFWRRFWR